MMRPFQLPGKITPDWYRAMVLQLDPDDDEAEQRIRRQIESDATDDIERALRQQARAVTASAPASVLDATGRAQQAGGSVRDILRRMLQQSADLGVSVAIEQFEGIGYGFNWTLANQAAAEWVERYTVQLYDGISQTTNRRLTTAIADWIENGDTLTDLRRELEPIFGRQRAELIASTEVTRAYAEANELAYRESGIASGREWRTAEDERVCPVCGPLEGEQRPFGQSFGDGVNNPPAHPRCRCWIVPVVED